MNTNESTDMTINNEIQTIESVSHLLEFFEVKLNPSSADFI